MRVLVADSDSEALEAVARVFEVDIATTKGTCIDLLRANEFDVLIAAERLDDGSGLELLSQVAKRWPNVVRILAIEPARRAMLKGKLAPFKLFDAIPYPMEEAHLQGVLERAADFCEPGEEADQEPPPPPARAAASAPSRATRSLPPYSSTLARTVVTSARTGNTTPSHTYTPASSAGSSHRGRPTAPTSSSAGRPRGPANPDSPPPLPSRASMRNYVPLGAPEQQPVRILPHEYSKRDPLVARIERSQEKPESASKASTIAAAVSAAVTRYIKPEPPPPRPPLSTRRKPQR